MYLQSCRNIQRGNDDQLHYRLQNKIDEEINQKPKQQNYEAQRKKE